MHKMTGKEDSNAILLPVNAAFTRSANVVQDSDGWELPAEVPVCALQGDFASGIGVKVDGTGGVDAGQSAAVVALARVMLRVRVAIMKPGRLRPR